MKSELRLTILSYTYKSYFIQIFFNSKLAKKYYPPINNALINKTKKPLNLKLINSRS